MHPRVHNADAGSQNGLHLTHGLGSGFADPQMRPDTCPNTSCHVGCRQRELIEQLANASGSTAAAELLGTNRRQLGQTIKKLLEGREKPLLLVLDDLWSVHQLTGLLGAGTRLPAGSQLLLTSRSSDVVASFNPVPMKLLPDASALAVLAWHACGETSLPADLAEVIMDALRGCGGLPLAVKVLGGALRQVPATRVAWKVVLKPCSYCFAENQADGAFNKPALCFMHRLTEDTLCSRRTGNGLSLPSQHSDRGHCGRQVDDTVAGDQLLGLAHR